MKITGTQEKFDFSNGYKIGGAQLIPRLRQRINLKFVSRLEKEWGGRSLLHGKTPTVGAIRLDGNDYLNLSGDPKIIDAQINALKKNKEQVVQAAIFHLDCHPSRLLEQELAYWLGHEDGMLCQSGYAANVGLIQAIADADTPVYIDALAHTSIWEGAKAAGAPAIMFRHNDPESLRKQMNKFGPGVVAVDSVYSTTGAVCPLTEMIEVTEQFDSMILVDESHSLGTHGPGGSGLCADLGVTDRVHFITASLAKAFAGRAGFFSCSNGFRNYALSECFPNIFSSSLLVHEIEGLRATLKIIIQSDRKRERLHHITKIIRESLTDIGYPIEHGSEQIIALEAGIEANTMILRDALEANEIFGAVFCAPATSKNRSMVRLTLNASITDVEIEYLIKAAEKICPIVKPREWPIARRQTSKIAALGIY